MSGNRFGTHLLLICSIKKIMLLRKNIYNCWYKSKRDQFLNCSVNVDLQIYRTESPYFVINVFIKVFSASIWTIWIETHWSMWLRIGDDPKLATSMYIWNIWQDVIRLSLLKLKLPLTKYLMISLNYIDMKDES